MSGEKKKKMVLENYAMLCQRVQPFPEMQLLEDKEFSLASII